MLEIYLSNLKEITDLIYEYWGFLLFNFFVFALSKILFEGVIRLWRNVKKHRLLTLIKKKK